MNLNLIFTVFFIGIAVILSGISMFKHDEVGGIMAKYALWCLVFGVIEIAIYVFRG